MDSIYIDIMSKIAIFWIIAVITPGPNFIITLNTSIQYGRTKALYTVGGIVLGTAIWVSSGLLGINVLFILAPWLYKSIKIIGAAYLIYLGMSKIFTKNPSRTMDGVKNVSNMGHFRRGMMVNLSNPKTAIFVSSLFVTTVPKQMGAKFSFICILTLIFISFIWYSFIAVVFSNKRIRYEFDKWKSALDKISGVLFILLGFKISLSDIASN